MSRGRSSRGRAWMLAAIVGWLSTMLPLAPSVQAANGVAQVVFTRQPGGGPAWSAWPTQPAVSLLNSSGAVLTTDNADQVRLSITTPSTAVLSCSATTVTVASGVAAFSGCSIDTPGTYHLTAVDLATGISGTSLSFTVVAAQNQLAFTAMPGSGQANTAFWTQPVVQIESPNFLPVAQAGTVTVTLQLAVNAYSATLRCAANPVTADPLTGEARFSGCSIDKPGVGYRIIATATATQGTAPTGITSDPFDLTAGGASGLVFSTQPAGAAAGVPSATPVVVTLVDSAGNATASTAAVTLGIATPPATTGAILSCSGGTTVNAVLGAATFTGCSIDRAGIGYKLTASALGLPVATSNAFTIDPAPATQVAFTTQPSATVGANTAFPVQPVVTIRDATGKTVTSSTAAVTLTLLNGTPGARLACTGGTSRAAVAGIATFSGCSIDLLGSGYVLSATVGALPVASSNAISVTAGAPAKLAFLTQPTGAAVSAAFPTQPVVAIQDASGNTVTSSTLAVTLAISTGTGTTGAALACSSGTSPAAVAGAVAYRGCSINKVGTGYTLRATSGTLVAATSVPIAITAGTASRLVFTTQPSGAAVGVPFGTQPVVAVVDAAGNVVTTSTATVTVSITTGTGTSGAALTCGSGTSAGASAGLAGFTSCRVDKSGTGYTLTAASAGLTSAVSAAFSIGAGPPAQLAFGTQPGSGVYGSALSPQPVVLIEDAAGNVVTTSTAAVSLTTGVNPTGGKLTCSSTAKAAVAGVATFSGCTIDKVGAGYTLTATAGGVAGASSQPFSIAAGPASKLAFTVQPGGAVYQAAFTSQPVVTVQDGSGNTATSYGGSVVLSITPGTGPSGAVLTCTGGLSAPVVSGVAFFAGCRIDRAATGYSLTATATGVTNATSGAFAVAPGAPSALAFGAQPVGASAGVAFATQPAVRIVDSNGNTVTGSSAIVSLAITSGTGTAGASLTCTGGPSKAAVGGVVTFSGCAIDLVGSGYTLTATSTSLGATTSAPLAVSPGPAAKLAFTTQPSGAAVGADFVASPVVAVRDAGGNTVDISVTVTLAVTAGTGTSGSVLSCAGGLTVAAVHGVATFSGCRISKVGTGYSLKATSGTLAAATSTAFSVAAGVAARIVVVTQPSGAAHGASFATAPVFAIQDAAGNLVTTSTAAVTLAISPGTGTASAALTCGGSGTAGLTIAATAGIASFPGCSIDKVGSGYTLTASSPGLASVATATVNIVAGPPARLTFTVQPSSTASVGTVFGVQPTVAIQDAAGNVVASSTLSVNLTLTGGTAGATLTCTTTAKAAVAGSAAFSGCKIDRAGAGYALTAAVSGLASATSTTISIASGPPAKLVFSTQPVGAAIRQPFATAPVVTIQDSSGNTVTSSSLTVSLAITAGTGAAGAVLSCPAVAAVAGVATFSGCSIDRAGAGYTLKATSGTLTSATSAAITVSPGPAAQLLFGTQPAGAAVATPFTTQPVVRVADSGGGTSTGSSALVTLALGPNAAGAALTCTGGLTVASVAGIATFSGCSVDRVGTGYIITASSGGLTPATSAAFAVAAGAPAKLVYTTQPGSLAAYGAPLGSGPVVAIQDRAGNPLTAGTGATLGVTLSITPGTGTPGAKLTCSGGMTKAAVAGIATFTGCSIDKAGTGYTITASSGTLTSVVSGSITITAGPAAKLAFPTQPSATAGAGTAFTSQPVVTIQDAAGNAVTSAVTVTLSLTGGPSSTSGTGPKLTCTGGLTKTSVAGVASFTGCSIDRVGTGYTLTASAGGLTSAKSTAIAVSAGAGTKLDFTTQPVGAAGGAALGKQPVVAIEDGSGNTDSTSAATVTLAIAAGTGTSGASLTCTGGLSKAALKGVASFAGCTIDKAGIGYRLTAMSGTLAFATSSAFDISQGPAKDVAFTVDPVGGPGGLAFAVQPVVAIVDAGKATVATSTAQVTLSITKGTGTDGATLACDSTLTVAAVNGVASFAGCSIDRQGTGYTLTATAQGLTVATSKPFDVSAPVAQVRVMPASATINQGSAVTLRLAFPYGGAYRTVQLQETLDGLTWRTVSDVVMDAKGTASFLYYIQTNRWFRASYAGDGEFLAGIGRSVRVLVRTSVTIRPTNGSSIKVIRRKTTRALTASVNAGANRVPATRVTYEVYKLVGKKWAFVTRRILTTSSAGRTILRWTFSSTGTWAIRASAASSAQNANSPRSAMERYRVV